MKKILFILGPNLNMVGIRHKEVYGTETAESINRTVEKWAEELGLELEIYQSNRQNTCRLRKQGRYNDKRRCTDTLQLCTS